MAIALIKTQNNKEYLKELTPVWYQAMIKRADGAEPTQEQKDKTEKNAKRNARRTLELILNDRLSTLLSLGDGDEVIDAAVQATRAQLKELEEFSTNYKNNKR